MNKSQSPRRSRGRSPKRTKSAPGNVQSNGRNKGNPKQLIEKYKSLARDALQAGDRVLAENYLQHADHYQRVLNDRIGPQVTADTDDEEQDDEDIRPERRRSRSQRARSAEEAEQPALDPRGDDTDRRRSRRQNGADDEAAAAPPSPAPAAAESGAVAAEPPRRRRAPRKKVAVPEADAQDSGVEADAMAK